MEEYATEQIYQRTSEASEHSLQKRINKAFKEGGIAAVQDCIRSDLDKWKKEEVKIAVIGRVGIGKSTFINAFRNLKNDQVGAAAVGVTETTAEVELYRDPNNPNIQLFDLPGVGSDSFPRNDYLEKIHVDKFDTFLLMTADKFTEDDTWLLNELKKRGKPFFFVRTKVWIYVQNARSMVSVPVPEETTIATIRNDCKKKTSLEDNKLFLIDSHRQMEDQLDFPRLRLAIANDLPELKRQALFDAIRDATKFTPNLIKRKGELLRTRTWKAALLSGAFGVVPIPGVSLTVDMGIISNETDLFANQLGLRGNDWINEERIRVPEGVRRQIKEITEYWSTSMTVSAITTLLVSTGVEKVVAFIPVIGVVIAGVVSFVGTKIVLDRILDKMIDDALEINEQIRDGIDYSTNN